LPIRFQAWSMVSMALSAASWLAAFRVFLIGYEVPFVNGE
jgi:hypothetical protein